MCSNSGFVIVVTLIYISSGVSFLLLAQAITWTKEPANPSFGVVGENVTLEWSFKEKPFVYFQLSRLEKTRHKNIILYNWDGGETVYQKYRGQFALAKNGTPAFMLIEAVEGDETEYCCEVSTKVDNDDRCVQLKILARPIIAISRNQTFNETDDVTLFCNATGKPTPTVTWSKRGNKQWNHPGSLLPLNNISRYQDGEYWCTAENSVGNVTASVTVTVNYSPSINLSATSYNVTEGDDLNLECISDGHPPPIVTWAKVGGLGGITNPVGQQLTIRKANRTQAGTYTCTSANGIGKPATAAMKVTAFFSPSVVSKVSNRTLNETQDLRLVCNATGNPQPQITWSKESDPNPLDSIDGALTVKYVNKSDSGVYLCSASNDIGSDTIALSTVIVNYKPIGTRFTSDAQVNTVVAEHSVTFSCAAESLPLPKLELRFNSKTIGWFQNGRFAMQSVNVSHQGLYECVPHNLLGSGPIVRINLTVLVSPSIDYISHNITVNETDDVKLFCNASGNPIPRITWSFLGDSVKMTPVANETLILIRVNRAQTGSYRCTAANSAGKPAVADVKVEINYKPEIIEGQPREIISWINHKTEITCKAEGTPMPEITWSRNGTVTSSTLFPSRVSTLTFTPQQAEDFGVYVCMAKNLIGTTKRNVTVQLLAAPAPPKILQVDSGLNDLEIHWKVIVTDPKFPILDYLVQIKEKGESQKWTNCTTITTEANSMMCVMGELKSNTEYVVRISARNVAGNSEFTVREVLTKEEVQENVEEQKGLPGSTVDWIIGGVIVLAVLVVVFVAIVMRRRSRLRGRSELRANGSSSKKVTVTRFDNPTMESNNMTAEPEKKSDS